MIKNKFLNIYGDGKQTRDWVHVEDIINAFLKAIKINHKKNGIIQLGSGKANTVNRLFTILKKNLNYEKKPNYCDKRGGDIKYMLMTNKKARKILKWKPEITLEQV